MRTHLRALALVLTGTTLASCNTGPYPSLGQPIDILQTIGNAPHVSFLRAHDGRLELLIVAKADPDVPDSQALFVYSSVGENESVNSWAGTWEYNEDNASLVLQTETLFVKPDEAGVDPIQAGGSYSEEDNTTFIIVYTPTAEELGAEEVFNGGVGEMADDWLHLDDVLKAIDPSTQDGAEELFSLVYATTYTVLARIPSFGGAGMIQYTDPGGTFNSVAGGTLHVELSGFTNPENFLIYDGYSDLSGVVLDGSQNNVSNTKGVGYYYGTLGFEIRSYLPLEEPGDTAEPPVENSQEEPPDDTGEPPVEPTAPYSGEPVFEGEIFFGNRDGTNSVLLEAPLPSGGAFKFTVDGERYEIEARGFTVRTLNGLLEELAAEEGSEE